MRKIFAALSLLALSAPAFAVTDYASMVTAATSEVGLAVTAGAVLFGLVFGIGVGVRILKKFGHA